MTLFSLVFHAVFMGTALSLGGIGPFNLGTMALATIVAFTSALVVRWGGVRVLGLDIAATTVLKGKARPRASRALSGLRADADGADGSAWRRWIGL